MWLSTSAGLPSMLEFVAQTGIMLLCYYVIRWLSPDFGKTKLFIRVALN